MKIFHLTWATEGRQPAFPTEEARRRVVRALAEVAGRDMALFAVVDDHVHIVVALPQSRLRRVQASITKVLNSRAAVRFSSPFLRPVTTRSHLESLVGYCLTQARHHGLAEGAALAAGSCFADLIGARRVPGMALQLATVLPRFQLRSACEAVGLAEDPPLAGVAELRRLGAAQLAEVVAAALCIGPGFSGNTAGVAEARRVAARLALDAGFRARVAPRSASGRRSGPPCGAEARGGGARGVRTWSVARRRPGAAVLPPAGARCRGQRAKLVVANPWLNAARPDGGGSPEVSAVLPSAPCRRGCRAAPAMPLRRRRR